MASLTKILGWMLAVGLSPAAGMATELIDFNYVEMGHWSAEEIRREATNKINNNCPSLVDQDEPLKCMKKATGLALAVRTFGGDMGQAVNDAIQSLGSEKEKILDLWVTEAIENLKSPSAKNDGLKEEMATYVQILLGVMKFVLESSSSPEELDFLLVRIAKSGLRVPQEVVSYRLAYQSLSTPDMTDEAERFRAALREKTEKLDAQKSSWPPVQSGMESL